VEEVRHLHGSLIKATENLENQTSAQVHKLEGVNQVLRPCLLSGVPGLLTITQQSNPSAINTLIHWLPDGSEKIICELPAGQYGPLAISDVDKDGDLDVFIGGQSPWGRFPVSSGSLLLRNDKGKFVIDKINTKTASALHNIQGTLFCDWDLDGDPDLIATSEWGGIHWLINDKGSFTDQSSSIATKKLTGIWQGLASGDFNEDGRPDLVVCNTGKNTHWSQWTAEAYRIYYSTKIRAHETITLRSYFNEGQWLPATPLEDLSKWMTNASVRFTDHADYANKNMQEIIGDYLNQFEHLEVNTLETIVLLNLPHGIQQVELDPVAQWAPCFGPSVADFNNDGHEDVFLGQNLDSGNLQWGRMDTGHGLLLLGDGKGNLEPISPAESGIRLKGEQRGAAFADFNQDGKMDLAVLESGEGAHVFVNQTERTGVTISLQGTASNPQCVGARMQKTNPLTGNVYGPAKEIQSGSGYQSLNSLKHVFASEEQPFKIQITWPDGKVSTHTIPTGITQETIKQP
jgi:hypothetical protein